MSERLSGNIEEVLQGIADAMDQRIDETLVKTMVLEFVLYAALSRMQAAAIIDSKWPDLLSGIASAHRQNATKAGDPRMSEMLTRVAAGVEEYTVAQGQAFKAPSLTVIDGGKAPTVSE